MSEAILECRNLKKYFDTPRGKLHAVDDVSFSIETGKTLGVVGESGCGKSTLGRTILRLLPATSGQVLFEGRNILECDKKESVELRRKMQIVFQDPYASLDPRKTVFQTIAEPLQFHKMYATADGVEARTYELMRTVGLTERYASMYPHEMDGGRRQRIGIARALSLNPKFVVCDEPVSALDVSIQAQVLNLLMDLQEQMGLTYMFITHNLSVVKHISDEIAVMYLGQMIERASSRDLFANPAHPYTKALLAAIPMPVLGQKNLESEALSGELTSPVDPKPGCRFAPRCPYATKECAEAPYQLREIAPNHWCACPMAGKL
ncbi:ABC transporter ATP-binding protein [Lawsonibacter celer]|uniref:ABC transporter ATP-binding protein n=1 Tax=Lawsonibacter celer TaxID=2986526 RepID=UPI00164873D9|nr:ABC transporter ATP-binding protein [Lawsonibacter celer]